jgi:hypothetical protein
LPSLVKAYSIAMAPTMMPTTLVLLVGLAGAGASCATTGADPGGLELGLKRGAGWSTLTVRPPRVTGPNAMLELKGRRLVGTFQNRPISVDITPDGLSGQIAGAGPDAGTVEVDITGGADDLEVAGLWFGQRVHLAITPESLRGTISGPAAGHCQFVLDRVDKTGARAGTSICWGLPEPTVLDLPSALPQVLDRAQIVALLLVLLSSPPITHNEAARPLAR